MGEGLKRAFKAAAATRMTRAWQSIDSAPRDGSTIELRIPKHRPILAYWNGGLVDSGREDCAGWFAAKEGEHPEDWSAGICWLVNEGGKPSTHPTGWRPKPPS